VAFVIALCGVTPAEAVRTVKRALSANNADAVNHIGASRVPKAGQLLPLGNDGRFPIAVIPTTARGPRGAEGPRGEAGPQGQRGGAGNSDIRLNHGAPLRLPQGARVTVQAARIDNLPAGKWFLQWTATADYGAGEAVDVSCALKTGSETGAVADNRLGITTGASYTHVFGSFTGVEQPQPFSAQLLCHTGQNTSGTVGMDDQKIVAIRADQLEITGG
jgi:hypothetical protein